MTAQTVLQVPFEGHRRPQQKAEMRFGEVEARFNPSL